MDPIRFGVRVVAWVTMVLVIGSARSSAAADVPATDANVDIVQFKSPSGWQVAERPGQPMKAFTAPGSNAQQQAVIVVMLAPAKDNLDLNAAFGEVVKQMSGANKVEQSGEPTAGKTRQGFPVLSQQIAVIDPAGTRASIRIVAANVQNRLAAFCYLGGPQAFFEQHQPEMDELLHSVSFNVPADNAAAAPPAVAVNPPAAAAVSGDFVAAVHERTAKAMDEARADFGKKLEGRRKPHTILGDVLGLDGKPVPNLVKCEISVGGISIAAERVHYSLPLDEHGHFEQQVPDGLYQVFAIGIVTVGGHRLPADLAPLGKTGHDESSDKGLVQDYRLVMDGLKPDADPNGRDAYYGGGLRLNQANNTLGAQLNDRFPGSKVQVLFEPQGPLIDGSTGQPFMLEVRSSDFAYGKQFQRLPIGAYHVTTKLITADGQARVLNTSQGFSGTPGQTIDAYWQSSTQWQDTREDPQLYVRD